MVKGRQFVGKTSPGRIESEGSGKGQEDRIKVLLYSTDSLCDFTSNNGTLSLISLRQEPRLA
jgi:hypothetical protein